MRALALALAAAATTVAAGPAVAARGDYVTRSFTEPASRGLEVTGPLSEFRAVARARVIVQKAWRKLPSRADRLRLITAPNRCRYVLTITVRSVVAEDGDAEERVATRLPASTPAHLLDSGRRGATAFRVVRRQTSGGRVRVDGLWNGVLTRRADIAPSGQVVWSEIRVAAASRPGDECHSGTYRQALGPSIGDALATARSRLFFVRG